jgi:hypothetical protein
MVTHLKVLSKLPMPGPHSASIQTEALVLRPRHPSFSLLVCLICFLAVLEFARQVLYHLSNSSSPVFVLGVSEIGSHKLFACGWLLISILLISAS